LHQGHFTTFDYPSASDTAPRGINNAGDITGNYHDGAGAEIGFILRDGEFHSVRVPDSDGSDVWAALDNGRVLVGDYSSTVNGFIHGYVMSRPGNFQNIDFPTALWSSVRWINERGDMVGNYCNTEDECASPTLHGFLLRQDKYTAIDVPGSISTEALAINDDGEVVGNYSDKKGNVHGFKAEPKDAQ
jgi:uncharacterized membrane protein